MNEEELLNVDPLIKNPVKLIGADYKEGLLYLKLNQDVSEKWVKTFKSNNNGIYYYDGYAPSNYEFKKDTAIIPTNPNNDNKGIVNYFKQYISTTNSNYRDDVVKEIRRLERESEQKIEVEKREEEARKKILDDIGDII